MDKKEKATEIHSMGYNCAQSVLLAMTDRTGMTEETSAAVAAGFGGGAGCRELCGALSGAFMATGTVLGAERRGKIMALDREITDAFREKFGAVRCAELKAAGISCDELIGFAAEQTEQILSRNEG